jgi:tryptophanyl-tRNA synthetase
VKPKDTEGSALFQIYQAFASDDETSALRQAYASGIGWAEAKQMVFERLDREITPMRERYEALMRDPGAIEDILLAGAAKARKLSTPFMTQLRHAVGLRNLRVSSVDAKAGKTGGARTALPSFKQYRESDGRFHFKLVDAQGRLLLQSQGFASPKDAGAAIGRLQKEGATAWQALGEQLGIAEGASENDVAAALQQLVEASSA